MSSGASISKGIRGVTYTCCSCRTKGSALGRAASRRSIHLSTIAKNEEHERLWQEQATEIRAGKKPSMLSILEGRGYVNQIAGDRDKLDKLMTSKRIGAYVGIDPTGPSLHLGHLVPLMVMFWMYVHGYRSISLLGGATAQVGDPIGRTTSRGQMNNLERKTNIFTMHLQLKKLWDNVHDHATKRHGYVRTYAWRRALVNNSTWLHKVSITEFMNLAGQPARVGTMLGRDTARSRMENGDGLSFAEFMYPLVQGWDWWHLYNTLGIQMQVGGSDQLGNIIAGKEVVTNIARASLEPDPVLAGFTVPLLTTPSGEKYGKSAGNALWLDAENTSFFDLYQYFMRLADTEVERYLKLFTFLPLPAIEKIMVKQVANPKSRVAHRTLANEVCTMVHGPAAAQLAAAEHGRLFPGSNLDPAPQRVVATSAVVATTALGTQEPDLPPPIMASGKPVDINNALNKYAQQTNAGSIYNRDIFLPKSLVYDQPMGRVLFYAGLAATRSEGHRLTANGGAYVGSRPEGGGNMGPELTFRPIKGWGPSETWQFVLEGNLLILRVGKWKTRLVRVISDEEFDAQGLDAPGWEDFKRGFVTAEEETALKRAMRIRKVRDEPSVLLSGQGLERPVFRGEYRPGMESATFEEGLSRQRRQRHTFPKKPTRGRGRGRR